MNLGSVSGLSFHMPTSADPVLRANQFANLIPWQTGKSGNVNGRPNSGWVLLEYVDELMIELEPGVGRYSLADLKGFCADERTSRPKAIAANLIVLASAPGFHEKSGKPYCAVLVDMILDRRVGKPPQTVHVHRTTTRPPAVIGADKSPLILQCFASLPPAERPALLAQMQALTLPVIDAEPVDPA